MRALRAFGRPRSVFAPGVFSTSRVGVASDPSASVTFKAFSADSALANLTSTLTVNGVSVAPLMRYEGKDATAATWSSVVGPALPIASTGTSPTTATDTPLTSTADKAVRFVGGKVYQSADATSGDLTTEDVLVEALMWVPATVAVSQISAAKRGTSGAGWQLQLSTTVRLAFTISDGVNTGSAAGQLAAGTWNHIIYCVDRSENSTTTGAVMLVNGVAVTLTTSMNPSLVTGSLTNAKALSIGSDGDLAQKATTAFAYLAVYKTQDWFAGGATNTSQWAAIAKERAARLFGIFPQTALGTAVPTTMTRSTTAYVDKIDTATNARTLFFLGPNWARLARRRELAGGEYVTGALLEPARTNSLQQSETLSNAAWTKTALAATTSATQTAPDPTRFATALVADATTGQHSASQASAALSVSPFVISVYARAGSTSWLVIENSTIPARAWFDVSTGTVGVVEAGFSEAAAHALGGGWFRCTVRFTASATAHTIALSPAPGNNAVSFAGDGVSTSLHVWGAQLEQADNVGTYIPTTTVQTRTVDTLTWTANDGNFPAAGSPFTLSADVLLPAYDVTTAVTPVLVGGTTTALAPNGASLAVAVAGDVLAATVTSASAAQMAATGTTDVADGEKHTLKLTVATNEGKLFVDGAQQGATDTSVALHAATPLLIACNGAAGANALVANLQINSAVI